MRRTDALTNFIAILLFLAFAAYAGISAARTLRSTTVTAEAVSAEVSLSATASGIVVREETVLTGGGRYMELLAPEGARVASGAPVAAEADSPESLARIARRRELEAEIARIDASRERLRAAEDLAGRQHGVSEAARDLASAAARHDMDALQSAAAVLDALLLGEDASISEARRAELERELESLQSGSFTGAETLAAPVSGVFSSAVDGWEHLRPVDLTGMTPSALEAMAAGGQTPPASAYGKLVTGYRWYFAAAMAAEDAASLTALRALVSRWDRGGGPLCQRSGERDGGGGVPLRYRAGGHAHDAQCVRGGGVRKLQRRPGSRRGGPKGRGDRRELRVDRDGDAAGAQKRRADL